jgi:hypothetical protein
LSIDGATGATFTSNSITTATFSGNLSGGVTIGAGQSISFSGGANVSGARTNLGLGLPALTNTSNVTTMRALAGSTNTNEPFSGTVEYHNHNADPFFMQISNGIILRIYE